MIPPVSPGLTVPSTRSAPSNADRFHRLPDLSHNAIWSAEHADTLTPLTLTADVKNTISLCYAHSLQIRESGKSTLTFK